MCGARGINIARTAFRTSVALTAIVLTSSLLATAGQAALTRDDSPAALGGGLGASESGGVESERSRHVFALDVSAFRSAVEDGDPVVVSTGEADLTLLVTTHEIFAPGEKKWVQYDEHGQKVAEGPITDVNAQGRVEGYEESRVALTISDRAVYGTLRVEGTTLNLRPVYPILPGPDGLVDHEINWRTQDRLALGISGPFALLGAEGGGSMGASAGSDAAYTGRVQMDAHQEFWDIVNDWSQRIQSAFNGHDTMWDDVDIDLQMLAVRKLPYLIESWHCYDPPYVTDDYGDWLSENSKFVSNADSYQLWTGGDLDGHWEGLTYVACYGVARPQQLGWNNRYAVSIVEGWDVYCCDRYDPDEPHERGIVSGHELTHNYGQVGHPSGCNSYFDCNIMEPTGEVDRLQFWRLESTKTEIRNYAHPRL